VFVCFWESGLGAFGEFSLLLIISAFAGGIALLLKQPVLIAYIVVGVLVGPAALGIVKAHEQIELLAQIGVSILLFVVGLKLDLKHIRHIGPVALATGLGQLAFTILFGFFIVTLLGKSLMEAIYVAVALTFSSTIIVVKLLSDKREIDSLHGRIAVGFLIVQDLAVVVAMMVMSTLKSGEVGWIDLTLSLALRISVAVVAMYVLMRYVLPRLVAKMASSMELLLIFAIAWGMSLAAIGEWAGFSKEAGAFLAGFSLASTDFRDAINARLTAIRDFLLLFFFIELGSQLDFSTLGSELVPALVLSIFVLVGNPLIVMAIMGFMGYRKRTGFLAGLTVAQISEFSIVFVAMGITLGHVGLEALGLTTLVGVITIALSTYMILYSHKLYALLEPVLGIFERNVAFREIAAETPNLGYESPDVIVFGLGRFGGRLAQGLSDEGVKVLGVDFDPQAVQQFKSNGFAVRFGDGIEAALLESLPLRDTSWVVSTIPDITSNKLLLQELHEFGFKGEIAMVAREDSIGMTLKNMGVHNVLYPNNSAVDHVVSTLTEILAKEKST
jgi:Kef-type K+ transport system membrane component KefB